MSLEGRQEKLSAGEDYWLSHHLETPERQEHGSIQSWRPAWTQSESAGKSSVYL